MSRSKLIPSLLSALALLGLLLPVGIGDTHGHAPGEPEHATLAAVASERCERDGSTHIESAELSEIDACFACLLHSKSRAAVRAATAWARIDPSAVTYGQPSDAPHLLGAVRLPGTRAPPIA